LSHEAPPLGFLDFDVPHDDLVRRASDLASAVNARERARAASILDGLLDATVFHFAIENELMEKSSYPLRVVHRTAHDLFIQDLHANAREIVSSGISPRVVDWASARLPDWLRFHMEANDRPLAHHLRRVKATPGTHSVQKLS